jgi:hypothetical protein
MAAHILHPCFLTPVPTSSRNWRGQPCGYCLDTALKFQSEVEYASQLTVGRMYKSSGGESQGMLCSECRWRCSSAKTW